MPQPEREVVERRYIPVSKTGLEIRSVESDKESRISVGYAAEFNSYSVDLGEFVEIIEPGFFRDALADPEMDCVYAFNHNPDNICARVSAGTLIVREDERGLYHEANIVESPMGDHVRANIAAGNVYQMSFAFTVRSQGDKWTKRADGKYERRLLPGGCKELCDVAPVTYPAYRKTSIQMRGAIMHEAFGVVRSLEELSPEDLVLLRNAVNSPDAWKLAEKIEQGATMSIAERQLRTQLLRLTLPPA